jgi:ribosome-associated protein
MIRITDKIALADWELTETFVRASGPGGQNVNKVSSAVELRFNVRASPSLSEAVKARLMTLAGARLTKDGEIVIRAQRFRTQERNRADARDRLVQLIRRAAEPPKPRKDTKVPRAEKRRRLEGKRRRSVVKQDRTGALDDD